MGKAARSSFATRLLCGALLLGAATASNVFAQEAPAPSAVAGVDFTDAHHALENAGNALNISAGVGEPTRLQQLQPTADPTQNGDRRRYEVALAADGEAVGSPVDISISQRASFGADEQGDLARQGRGAEVRIGQNLVERMTEPSANESSWYVFAASDDEALTWSPGANGQGVALQDRVEIGDVQAGVTYQRGPVQASLAYVERDVSAQVGRESHSEEERFTGVTVTMRH